MGEGFLWPGRSRSREFCDDGAKAPGVNATQTLPSGNPAAGCVAVARALGFSVWPGAEVSILQSSLHFSQSSFSAQGQTRTARGCGLGQRSLGML